MRPINGFLFGCLFSRFLVFFGLIQLTKIAVFNFLWLSVYLWSHRIKQKTTTIWCHQSEAEISFFLFRLPFVLVVASLLLKLHAQRFFSFSKMYFCHRPFARQKTIFAFIAFCTQLKLNVEKQQAVGKLKWAPSVLRLFKCACARVLSQYFLYRCCCRFGCCFVWKSCDRNAHFARVQNTTKMETMMFTGDEQQSKKKP